MRALKGSGRATFDIKNTCVITSLCGQNKEGALAIAQCKNCSGVLEHLQYCSVVSREVVTCVSHVTDQNYKW